jgi:peptide-methionine (S)-S-oxide reductase
LKEADVVDFGRIEDVEFRRAVELLDAGDVEGLREHLEVHPGLVGQRVVFEGGGYFGNPALLEFVAENPIRHGRLPANIVAVARVILEAGAEPKARDGALGLVASGRVARECGVQVALIELLCGAGADADGAMYSAVVHGEFAAVEALIRCGAKVDLPVAAALGRDEEFGRLLPGASASTRHFALAFAAQFGRVEMVRALLDAGEDASRYNPVGAHGHSTPLHQAALAGHMEVVRLLVERGARLDLKDTVWGGTPEGWARHDGRTEIAEYLRERAGAG